MKAVIKDKTSNQIVFTVEDFWYLKYILVIRIQQCALKKCLCQNILMYKKSFEHSVKDKITHKQLKCYYILPDRWYNKDKIYFHKKLRITAKIGYLLSQFPTKFLLQYAKKKWIVMQENVAEATWCSWLSIFEYGECLCFWVFNLVFKKQGERRISHNFKIAPKIGR